MAPNFAALVDHPIPRIEIVDVGAMVEGRESYHALVESGMCRVTGFEPDKEQFAKLQGRPGPYRYFPYFLGNGSAGTFHIARYPGCSSLLRPNAALIDLFETIGCAVPGGNFHVLRTEPVETVRMDDLGPELEIDFLKLDIQGGELEVLRNATKKLATAVVIECEAEFVPLYEGQPLFGDIQCFLREHGFVLHKFIDVAGRPFKPFRPPNPFLPMSQVLWGDAVFVRDFTRLESFSSQGLLKAAAVLDVVYGSYDLSALLLGAYDGRHGTGLQQRYYASLGSRQLNLRCMNLKDHP